MNPRERLLKTLNHEEPDRVPVDLGGFVFNSVHNIQADVPPENIVAMFDMISDYGKYS